MGDEQALRAASERVEQLLGELVAADPHVGQRVHELVRLLAELYGEGLGRIVAVLNEADAAGELMDQIVADELVASLLLVHDLHPRSLRQRVEQALEDVRPYLGSHGGDVEIVDIDDHRVVHLRMLGSCDGCPSSARTLELAVSGAIEAAAPEVTGIEVTGAESGEQTAAPTLISPESLSRRPDAAPTGATGAAAPGWAPVPEAGAISPGAVAPVTVSGFALVVCRTEQAVLAYRDACARCGSAFGAGRLDGIVLACPSCAATFDVEQAGRGIADPELHLDPLPLLDRHGQTEVALPQGVA